MQQCRPCYNNAILELLARETKSNPLGREVAYGEIGLEAVLEHSGRYVLNCGRLRLNVFVPASRLSNCDPCTPVIEIRSHDRAIIPLGMTHIGPVEVPSGDIECQTIGQLPAFVEDGLQIGAIRGLQTLCGRR